VNKIEIAPAALPLAPAAKELEFRGPILQSGWSISLKDEIASQFSIISTPDDAERIFPLCYRAGPEEKTLLLGAIPRGEVAPKVSPKEPEKRR